MATVQDKDTIATPVGPDVRADQHEEQYVIGQRLPTTATYSGQVDHVPRSEHAQQSPESTVVGGNQAPTSTVPPASDKPVSGPMIQEKTNAFVQSVKASGAAVSNHLQQQTAAVTSHIGARVDGVNSLVDEHKLAVVKEFTADSHDYAHDPSIGGAVVRSGGGTAGVRDIGWHKTNDEIPDPLIEGLSNGEMFAMIRRFNKDVFAVQSVPSAAASGLDLNEAWSDEYTSDKTALHLQRVYLRIVLGLASLGKQVSRLRSWKETQRTSLFCGAYLTAWLLDLLVPLGLGTLMLIISSKTARDILFPPAPRALVNMSTGGLQDPAAGQLGTLDSLTGAPEKQQGEAVEEEAANFVTNVRHLVQRAVGVHQNEDNDGDPLEGKVPKPIRDGVKAIKAKGAAAGHATGETDQTQEPMEKVLWDKANPEKLSRVLSVVPHVVGEVVDNWERFANAISPVPPFSTYAYLRLDAVILPLFLSSFLISSYLVYKGIGFGIGMGLFGDPVLSPALAWLNQNYPKWAETLQPKNNILRGVPTNTQMTITLLRIGEAYNTPLPPVPTSNSVDQNQQTNLNVDKDIPLNAPRTEKLSAIQNSAPEKGEQEHTEKHSRMSKFTRIFRSGAKATAESKLAIDHVRAAAGSKKAKDHIGVLPKSQDLIYAGPSHFKARYNGKKGWLYITQGSTPVLVFTMKDPRAEHMTEIDLDPLVAIEVEGIQLLKRATAFASKPVEAVADWSENAALLGSVEVQDRTEKLWRFTAIPERDELFNRLVAMGGQRWQNL